MQCELYVRWFYIQSEYGKIRSKQPRIRTPFTQFELHVRWFCIQSENGKNTEQKKTDFGYFDPEWWWLYSIALLVLEINETENLARKWVKRQGRADASFKATAWERNPSKCYLELLLKDFVLYPFQFQFYAYQPTSLKTFLKWYIWKILIPFKANLNTPAKFTSHAQNFLTVASSNK